MVNAAALKQAVELVHMPSRVRALRAEPVPDGMTVLLEIAAGEEAPTAEAVLLIDRPPQVIRQAAAFYIEQILLSPDADSYRVLGSSAQASTSELRRNMALLLRWLHPDLDQQGQRSLFAGRVTKAWEDLKTPERRAAYDSELQATSAIKLAAAGRSNGRNPAARAAAGPKSPVRGAIKPGAPATPGHPAHRAAQGFRAAEATRSAAASPSGFWARAMRRLLGAPRR